jgi:hypothetical protein
LFDNKSCFNSVKRSTSKQPLWSYQYYDNFDNCLLTNLNAGVVLVRLGLLLYARTIKSLRSSGLVRKARLITENCV